MYNDLKTKKINPRPEIKKLRNPDLEDGEIASDREERRPRDPYRDLVRDDRRDRRDDRRDDGRDEPQRRNYYDDFNRLRPSSGPSNDRGVAARHSYQSHSPPNRHYAH